MSFPILRDRRFMSLRSLQAAAASAVALALMTGCSHHRQTAYTPPPPGIQAAPPPSVESAPVPQPEYRTERHKPTLSSDEEYVRTHRPIYAETGMASWYGPPYNNHAGANGRIYDENAISAANRTLPMGSLVRVTYLRTGESEVMRITDRGPFVGNRILDLSEGAAKAIGLYRAGVGEVRIDVYSAPEPLASGGRWCVQVGAFSHRRAAVHLQERLEREYRTASVIEFQGPTGYWVRIRPYEGNRTQAIAIVRRLHPSEGEAWLVRLD
jgi:rare lipoprotein A